MGFPRIATSSAFIDYGISGSVFSSQDNVDTIKDYVDPRTVVSVTHNINYTISGLTAGHNHIFYFNNLGSTVTSVVINPTGDVNTVRVDLSEDDYLDPFQQVYRLVMQDVRPDGGNTATLQFLSQGEGAISIGSLTIIDQTLMSHLDDSGFFTFPLTYDLNTTILDQESGGGQYDQKERRIVPGLKIDLTPIAVGGQNIKGKHLSNIMKVFHRLGSDLFIDFNTGERWQAYIGQINNLPRVNVEQSESGFIKFQAIQFVTKW